MTVTQAQKLCGAMPHAHETLKSDPSNILVYTVSGNQFAYFKTSEPHRGRMSVRCTAERFLELTDQPGITPARYMSRFHWVSMADVTTIADAVLKALVKDSYDIAVARLTKKQQRDLI